MYSGDESRGFKKNIISSSISFYGVYYFTLFVVLAVIMFV